MARKRYSDEDILKLLREIEVHLYDGMDVIRACRKAGISDKPFIAAFRYRAMLQNCQYCLTGRSTKAPDSRSSVELYKRGVFVFKKPINVEGS